MGRSIRHLWRLATASWRASPGKTAAITLSVALGTGTITVTTNLFETARRGITDEVVTHWLGSAHVSVHPVGAHHAAMDASIAGAIASVDGVKFVTARLRRRLRVVPAREGDRLIDESWWSVDAIGIDPQTERHFFTPSNLEGRMPKPQERGVATIERAFAKTWGVRAGDILPLTVASGEPTATFKVVGLFDGMRVATFQRPRVYLPIADLQSIRHEPGIVSAIDVMLKHPSREAIAQVKQRIERLVAGLDQLSPIEVDTAEARFVVLSEAERVTRLLLMLMALVAMLTSFFIIVTTQGVSLIRRRVQLGVMRCVGLTRRQLLALLLLELTPPGVFGTALGVAAGIGATYWVAAASTDLFIHVYLSPWGLWASAVCGLLTTLFSTLALSVQTATVSPLQAVHPEARPARVSLIYASAALGVVLLVVHQWMAWRGDRTAWLGGPYAVFGTAALHFGYALLTPLVMIVPGRHIARFAGRCFGSRPGLAEEPVTRGPWRSSGTAWVLMVGLSMIVYSAVRSEGILAIWDFPARLPEAFVWSADYVPANVIERVKQVPGVRNVTVTADVDCELTAGEADSGAGGKSIIRRFLRRLTRPVFVVSDPDDLLNMIKVAFIAGERDEAVEKLKRGGFVLIPPQTARNKHLSVGDHVTVTIRGIPAEFEVAGVIQSPALDLAVTAFQAESYMQFAAASAVLGTRADLRDKFGLDVVSMFMFDVDLPPSPAPPDFDPKHLPDFSRDASVARVVIKWADHLPNERDATARIVPTLRDWVERDDESSLPEDIRDDLRCYARALQRIAWSVGFPKRTRQEHWDRFRERLVLFRVAQTMDRPNAIMGSLRGLKRFVDLSFRRATTVLTWLPSIMLIVASIGIANLMMVSVHLRSRQLAVLRSVGALKSQIVRLVLAEAVTLGVVGSMLGVLLGLHEAYSVNEIATGLIDVSLEFIVPAGTICGAVALTVAVCLMAAAAPARYASRENIIDVLYTT